MTRVTHAALTARYPGLRWDTGVGQSYAYLGCTSPDHHYDAIVTVRIATGEGIGGPRYLEILIGDQVELHRAMESIEDVDVAFRWLINRLSGVVADLRSLPAAVRGVA